MEMSSILTNIDPKILDDMNDDEFNRFTLWGALLEDEPETFDDECMEPMSHVTNPVRRVRISGQSASLVPRL